MADEPTTTAIDSWTSRVIIVALGLALLLCIVALLVPPLVGINLPSVMGERLYNLANALVTGLFALFSPLAAQALVKK